MTGHRPFRDREDAGRQLAAAVRDRAVPLIHPLVLGIPRGGVVVGAVVARALGADLDAILARKLRAPFQPELALGAIGEDGRVYLDPAAARGTPHARAAIEDERRHQLAEIARRSAAIRAVRPAAPVNDRTVIITDDGLATGSTMIAALRTLRPRRPASLIAAVPVAAPDRFREVSAHCDAAIAVITPDDLRAVGQYYDDFDEVDDGQILALLRSPSAYGQP